MRIPLFKRLTITALNILFPPLAVALLTGWTSHDTLLNTILFLLAILPSHIHAFYISLVYFTRKRRVRHGKYPGQPHKAGIWSERVLTGGAGWKGAEALKPTSRRERKRQSMRERSRSGNGRESGYDSDFLSRQPSGRGGRKTFSRQNTQRSGFAADDDCTDAQMSEARNIGRVGSQVGRTGRHF